MKKLFIYIPTFNRPKSLETQLSVLAPQVKKFSRNVRIVVNDNNSSKNIEHLIKKYNSFKNINFIANPGNIGGNANISLGFIFAESNEFLWILSDNDIVTENSVSYILNNINYQIDFLIFNYDVDKEKEIQFNLKDGFRKLMDWRCGLISDGIYNMRTIKNNIYNAFYYHNSSFPHLAVIFSTLLKINNAKIKLLPRNKINKNTLDSSECTTDYSLAYIGMLKLLTLFPPIEAYKFSTEWLIKHFFNFYLHRKEHYDLFVETRAIIWTYGGIISKVLLLFIPSIYYFIYPFYLVKNLLKSRLKQNLSKLTISRIKKLTGKL